MIVSIEHPNWLEKDEIFGENRKEVAFTLRGMFISHPVREFVENGEKGDTFLFGNYKLTLVSVVES